MCKRGGAENPVRVIQERCKAPSASGVSVSRGACGPVQVNPRKNAAVAEGMQVVVKGSSRSRQEVVMDGGFCDCENTTGIGARFDWTVVLLWLVLDLGQHKICIVGSCCRKGW